MFSALNFPNSNDTNDVNAINIISAITCIVGIICIIGIIINNNSTINIIDITDMNIIDICVNDTDVADVADADVADADVADADDDVADADADADVADAAAATAAAATVVNNSNPNNGNLASENELELNSQALILLKTLLTSELRIAHVKATSKRYLDDSNKFVVAMLAQLKKLDDQRALPSKHRSDITKKTYNVALTSLFGNLKVNSSLHNLLFINSNLLFVSKRIPRERNRVDFADGFGDSVKGRKHILHVMGSNKIGARTAFDTSRDCLSALRASLERCTNWDQVDEFRIINGKIDRHEMSLKIPFIGTDFWINSDSPKITHILCDGNPPKISEKSLRNQPFFTDTEFRTLYPVYDDFLNLVAAQIRQIVLNSHNNNNCPYTIIPCCRIDPVCAGETWCKKPSQGNNNLVVCGTCRMELCANGCGRAHHGNTPCTVTVDEASEIEIQASTKLCPLCPRRIQKNDGCNHMTCFCGCQFCWTCGLELPKDDHGHYSTTMHYSPNVYGLGVGGGCNQFA